MLKQDTAASGEIIFLLQSKLLAIIILENANISDPYLALLLSKFMTCQERIFPALFMKSEVIITFSTDTGVNVLLIKPVGIRRGTKQFAQLLQLFQCIVNDIRASLSVVI